MKILKKIWCSFIQTLSLFFSKLYTIYQCIFLWFKSLFKSFQADSFQEMTQSSSYDMSLESEADLQTAINQSAGHLRGLWIGYISLAAYLVVTALTVTHRDLFLELPIELPILGIKLSLYGFFITSPIVFIGLYLYFIFHLRILYAQVVKYQKICSNDVEFKKRFLFDPFVFIQYWVGHARDRKSRIMFWLIDFCSIVFLPFIVLLFLLLCALPYHDSFITYSHRIMMLITLFLIFLFRIYPILPLPQKSIKKIIHIMSPIVVFIGMFKFLFGVMVFPGEDLYDKRPAFLKTATHFILESSVDNTTGEATKFFTNHLVLANEDFVDDDVLEKMDKRDDTPAGSKSREVINRFGGRHLENAIFDYTDLRRSDFSGAYIAGASFINARLDKSDFNCSELVTLQQDLKSDALEYTNLRCVASDLEQRFFKDARVKQSNFNCNKLTALQQQKCEIYNPNVNFSYSDLHQTNFINAQLPNANFYQAHLNKTDFSQAQLQNANLSNVFLYGANLSRTNLQGANLFFAFLHGTDLTDSQLQGAYLEGVRLKGVNLTNTGLQGVDFTKAELFGVNFKQAGLQGTNFECAIFRKTYMPNVNIWNSNIIYDENDDRKYLCLKREIDIFINHRDDNEIVKLKTILSQALIKEKSTCKEVGCQEKAQKEFDMVVEKAISPDEAPLKRRDDKEGWVKNLLIAKDYRLKECLEDKECKDKVEMWFKNIVDPDIKQVQIQNNQWSYVYNQYVTKDKNVFLNDFWKYRATLVCHGNVYMETMMVQIDDFKEYKPIFAQSFFELENNKKCRNINPSITPKQRLTLEDWADI